MSSINYNQAASEWNQIYSKFESLKNAYFNHTGPSNLAPLASQLNQLQGELNNLQKSLIYSSSELALNFANSLYDMVDGLFFAAQHCSCNIDPSQDLNWVQSGANEAQSALQEWAANQND